MLFEIWSAICSNAFSLLWRKDISHFLVADELVYYRLDFWILCFYFGPFVWFVFWWSFEFFQCYS